MDYEKAYKDLMEKVEAVKKDPRIGLNKGTYYNGYVQTGIRDALEYITTKESEDERVRNVLIEIIRNAYEYGCVTIGSKSLYDELIAYLGKQKELPTNEEMLRTLRAEYEKGVADTIAKYEQKEQKPANEKEYIRILKGLVADFVRDKQPKDVVLYQRIFDYLDGISVEQKPAEWSEEEKGILLRCISALQNSSHWLLADKLSSLRPQPHWKPSEEQMEALDNARFCKSYDRSELDLLYEQLKKRI